MLLLPAFFAFTGLRTQIGLVDGAFAWLVCGVIVLVACARQVRRQLRGGAPDGPALARRRRRSAS